MRNLIILAIVLIIVSCGGGSPSDPEPLAKTFGGYWVLTSTSVKPASWPSSVRVQVYGNNVGGELVLPEAMRSAWGGYVESLDMRVRSYPVIPGTVIYNSRESFGGSHLYAQFTYRQAASVDSIVFTLPGEPVLTISYNAKWDGVNP